MHQYLYHIRIYREYNSYIVIKNALKRFDIFCKEHKEFSKQDLLSQALEDFMIKHEDS